MKQLFKIMPLLCLCGLMLLSGCNALKFVPEGKKLYTGADVKVISDNSVKGKNTLENKIEDVIGPKPNSRFLWMRVGLWAHYKVARGDSGFIPKFLNKKYGEKPVYLDQVKPDQVEKLITNRCENSGFFYSEVSSSIEEHKKIASANYTVKVSRPYTLATYQLMMEDTSSLVVDYIKRCLDDTELKPGTRFDIDKFTAERERIDDYLKVKGWYQFNPDFLIFTTDTNHYKDRKFDLYLSFKKETPNEVKIPYRIKKVYVFPNYSVKCNENTGGDTIVVDDIDFIQDSLIFKPRLLRDYLTVNPGDMYSKKDQNVTNHRLSSIGNFQLVSIRYTIFDSITEETFPKGALNAFIRLTPAKKQALRLEVQGVTKSTSFAGPGINGTYRNRNLFKGGEILEISGNASYETQIVRGKNSGLSSFEFKLSNSLTFPRLIAPVTINPQKGFSIPKTRFALNYTLQDRAQYYKLNSFQFSYGYSWNTSELIHMELNPVSITYTTVGHKTPEFRQILENNTFLARSFENQFIPEITYTIEYSELHILKHKHRFYINLGADAAGTLLNLAQNIVASPHRLFGQPYAEFVKLDGDFRHYWYLDKEHRLVSRLFAGVGFPYGNSQSLPYVKQYFAGGPNSIRAFRVRSVGPGGYEPPDSLKNVSFFDQSGDIRLEFNTEYRFPIVSLLKGAVFADAGNIWLKHKNPDIPNGEFTSNWYKQIAVGTGFGLRLDISVLVIRLDISFPLRYTYPQENGSHWQHDFAFGNHDWRKQNLVWNFAIGYPF